MFLPISLHYMAPELFRGDQEKTKQSDVFAFAMLIIEVHISKSFPALSNYLLKRFQAYTGREPFAGLQPLDILKAILSKQRPRCPFDCSDKSNAKLWKLTEYCWEQDPQDRPCMRDVGTVLHTLLLPVRDYKTPLKRVVCLKSLSVVY